MNTPVHFGIICINVGLYQFDNAPKVYMKKIPGL